MVTNSSHNGYGSLNLKLIHTCFSKKIDHINLNQTLFEIFNYPIGSILSEVYFKMGITAPIFILSEEEPDVLERFDSNMKLIDLLTQNSSHVNWSMSERRREPCYYLYIKSSSDRINNHLYRTNQIARSNNLSSPIRNRESVLELYTIERLNSHSMINTDGTINTSTNHPLLSNNNSTINTSTYQPLLSNNNVAYMGECIVCFERKLLYNYYSCQLNSNYRETESHHGMCENCIIEWLNRNNSNSSSCPTCRAPPGSLRFPNTINVDSVIHNAATQLSLSIRNNLLQVHNIDNVTLNSLDNQLTNLRFQRELSSTINRVIQVYINNYN